MDTTFVLPRPQLVHGSFFTDVAFRVRSASGRQYGVTASASNVAFSVVDVASQRTVKNVVGVWKQWWEEGLRVVMKQSTIYVRANGWEVNATRHPVYNYVAGPSKWRYDFAIRSLDDTPFEFSHGRTSPSCFPHGVIGQSWDGDNVGINGRMDDYKYDSGHAVVVTSANAEGAIEGIADDYALASPFDVSGFKYDRFDKNASSVCAPRATRWLTGQRVQREGETSKTYARSLEYETEYVR